MCIVSIFYLNGLWMNSISKFKNSTIKIKTDTDN